MCFIWENVSLVNILPSFAFFDKTTLFNKKFFTCEGHFWTLLSEYNFQISLFFEAKIFSSLHKLYLNFALNSATDNLPLGQSLLNPSYQS